MPRSDAGGGRRSAAILLASVALASACALAGIGCSSSPEASTSPADVDGGAGQGDAAASADAAPRPQAELLPQSTYADLVTLDPSFPFGVASRHAADDGIVGSRWGRHGGPMVTKGAYGAQGASRPGVVAWAIAGGPTAPAVRTETPIAIASGLPATLFYGADGMVDLPFGGRSLLSYTGSGAAFPGEILLYSSGYDRVESRAKVNGFYSGVGVESAAGPLVVYSGLSVPSTTPTTTNDNGLYASPICDGNILAPSPCATPWRLFGWKGQSGPVAVDAMGNVFVGASLSSGSTSDAVLGIARAQLVVGSPATAATVAEVDTRGTASIAAVAPEGDAPGWLLGLGYDDGAQVYAASYRVSDASLTAGTLAKGAISPATGVSGLSVFTDVDGDLWLAVTKGTSGAYLELRRRAP
ncbi:MAG: hypothetical protein JST00_08190 [Deltaproteobacteria bacterium]|nr:hypothetical protein [Deltaproteobacteria bacterium]